VLSDQGIDPIGRSNTRVDIPSHVLAAGIPAFDKRVLYIMRATIRESSQSRSTPNGIVCHEVRDIVLEEIDYLAVG
jgi:hypothetical protein